MTQEEKGVTKLLNVAHFEKDTMSDEPLVMLVDQMTIGKRSIKDKDGRSGAGPRKNKGKSHGGEDVKAKGN